MKFDGITIAQRRPGLADPMWQMCCWPQFLEPAYGQWGKALFFPDLHHRKLWEWAYIMQALTRNGGFQGRRGLGFAVGKEPLAASMAAHGAHILATDMFADVAVEKGWAKTDQHAGGIADLRHPQLCVDDVFRDRVQYREVDMNDIPRDLHGQFDFVWSSCAFEHLGSIEKGLAFVENAMACLKPGGIGVHTTEYNLSSNDDTLEEANLCIFRQRDLLELAGRLVERGHRLPTISFDSGDSAVDLTIDLPPYKKHEHVKLRIAQYDCTSFGLYVLAKT